MRCFLIRAFAFFHFIAREILFVKFENEINLSGVSVKLTDKKIYGFAEIAFFTRFLIEIDYFRKVHSCLKCLASISSLSPPNFSSSHFLYARLKFDSCNCFQRDRDEEECRMINDVLEKLFLQLEISGLARTCKFAQCFFFHKSTRANSKKTQI